MSQHAGKLKINCNNVVSTFEAHFDADGRRFCPTTLGEWPLQKWDATRRLINRSKNVQRQNQFSRFAVQRRIQ
jgi:hypothetical protein